MANPTVACSKCAAPLPSPDLATSGSYTCPTCRASLYAYVFPALLRAPLVDESGAPIVMDGAAGCFYHPHRQAVVPCAQCGRFLCSLCEVELHGRHLCLTCLSAGTTNGAPSSLAPRHTLHDSIALRIAMVPVIGVLPTLLYTLRHWRSPVSLVPRTKIRFVVALVLSGLQILVGMFFLWR